MHIKKPLAFALSLCLFGACKTKEAPAPEKEPQAVTKTESPPTPSAVVSAKAPAKVVPTLIPERFAPGKDEPDGLFGVEGAIMVSSMNRVGRIVDDEKIEWVGEVPKERPSFGLNMVRSIHGKWPDRIDVVYANNSGRAPEPTYVPLTGKGRDMIVGEGGSPGWIIDVLSTPDQTFVAKYSPFEGASIISVRGKRVGRRSQSPKQAGCKGDELEMYKNWPEMPAIRPEAFSGTDSGILMTTGTLCDKRGPAVEVWDESGKSRIIDLSPWIKSAISASLIKGKGEELWLHTGGKDPILRYQKGTFEPLPPVGEPVSHVFVSAKGKLHAHTKTTLYRFDEGKWTPVAHFNWEASYRTLVLDENDKLWAGDYGAAYRFHEGPSTVFSDDCKTPFVYLYDVSPKNDDKFTFPSTRKAMASFAEASELHLVDFPAGDRRRLGMPVASKAQGEAVIAHVKANMKDENPKLLCYAPTKAARTIEIMPKEK